MIKTYAVIENGKVANIVLAEKALADNWVVSTKAAIGDDFADGKFIKPVQEQSEKTTKKDRIDLLIDTLVFNGLISEDDADKINRA